MSDEKPAPQNAVVIKKYANRRLYNTSTSTYVTLDDLATMVKGGTDFLVYDAKSGEDITRSVLTQIIFEQEGKVGQAMLPVAFLRQLIRFYGDSMQALVPSYLEFTLDRLTSEQQKFRDQFTNVLGSGPLAEPTRQMFQAMDEQTRKNMTVFRQALSMFNPFVPGSMAPTAPRTGAVMEEGKELDELRKQVGDLQKRIDGLSTDRS